MLSPACIRLNARLTSAIDILRVLSRSTSFFHACTDQQIPIRQLATVPPRPRRSSFCRLTVGIAGLKFPAQNRPWGFRDSLLGYPGRLPQQKRQRRGFLSSTFSSERFGCGCLNHGLALPSGLALRWSIVSESKQLANACPAVLKESLSSECWSQQSRAVIIRRVKLNVNTNTR